MANSDHDRFGDGSEPATPGSYGEPPAGYRLPARTRIGGVTLQVSDLDRSLHFYTQTIGLQVVERTGGSAVLAAHGSASPLVMLQERAGARRAGGRLGLYHFALLLGGRATLGRFVRHLADEGARFGAADHLVSEALYLTDPDGLGIEVYADRPRESWRRLGRELMLTTDPLDLAELGRAGGDATWTGMPAGTAMGHVHLHVGDLAGASAFYSEALGFDRLTWRYPGALFLGAGGYHHHLGANSWAGPDARPAAADEARLMEWRLVLPAASDVADAAASVVAAGSAIEPAADGSVLTRDPWGTPVRLSAGD